MKCLKLCTKAAVFKKVSLLIGLSLVLDFERSSNQLVLEPAAAVLRSIESQNLFLAIIEFEKVLK